MRLELQHAQEAVCMHAWARVCIVHMWVGMQWGGKWGLRINTESVEKAQDWVPRDRGSCLGFVAGWICNFGLVT